MESSPLLPNNEVIASLIGEYSPGSPTTLYGNASSGKTTTCLLAAIQAAREGKVIFVDTESSFDTERLRQLAKRETEKILENIFLIQPKGFEEQQDTILKLHRLCDNPKIRLVVVDTIGNHYRVILKSDPRLVNSMMALQLQALIRIARDLGKVVLLTSQVTSVLDSNLRDEIKAVGGKMLMNSSRCVIELFKGDLHRVATLVKYKSPDEKKHPNLGKKVRFEIREDGLFLS